MKVLNLRCVDDHGFEGWFASEDDYLQQCSRGLVACPVCGSTAITRLPSAPRLNLSGAREPVPAGAEPTLAGPAQPPVPDVQALWLKAVQQVLQTTDDVGERFPEEARRIHYGEAAQRGIRGQATADERAALADEGIEVMPLPIPAALKGPRH